MGDDDDAISNALASRRMPHGRARRAGGKGGSFNVFRAIAEYTVSIASKDICHGRERPCKLIVLGLTPNEDGLLATFVFGDALSGMAVLAGSRKVLRSVVSDLEREDEEDEDEDEDEEIEGGSGNESVDAAIASGEDETETVQEQRSDPEASDALLNRLAHSFEKNTFRTPKFWMQWKGRVKLDSQSNASETNMAYVVFSGNDCEKLEGSITCESLDWQNVKLRGFRDKSLANQTYDMDECRSRWRTAGQ